MSKTAEAVIAKRVEDIYGLVVDGQPLRVIRQFMADTCDWEVDDRTLRRYMRRATDLIVKRAEETCSDVRERHIARLERLYAGCVAKGDRRTALAVEQEIAKLHGLNAPTRAELTGLDGAPLVPATVDELAEKFDQLIRDMGTRVGKE